jgi:hypothetical protein
MAAKPGSFAAASAELHKEAAEAAGVKPDELGATGGAPGMPTTMPKTWPFGRGNTAPTDSGPVVTPAIVLKHEAEVEAAKKEGRYHPLNYFPNPGEKAQVAGQIADRIAEMAEAGVEEHSGKAAFKAESRAITKGFRKSIHFLKNMKKAAKAEDAEDEANRPAAPPAEGETLSAEQQTEQQAQKVGEKMKDDDEKLYKALPTEPKAAVVAEVEKQARSNPSK